LVRPTTLQDYESQVRNHVLPELANARVQALTTPALQRYYDGMLAAGKGKRTAQVAVQRLSSALGHAVHMQYVQYNAAVGVRMARPDHREMQVWTPEQAARFLELARVHMYHPLWDLALSTGMRRGELLGLRWEDVDFERALLSVRRTIEPVPGGRQALPPKNGRARTVDLDGHMVALLREHRVRQAEKRLRLGDAWADAGIVLASAVGTWITPDNVTRECLILLGKRAIGSNRYL
jgi:integrase